MLSGAALAVALGGIVRQAFQPIQQPHHDLVALSGALLKTILECLPTPLGQLPQRICILARLQCNVFIRPVLHLVGNQHRLLVWSARRQALLNAAHMLARRGSRNGVVVCGSHVPVRGLNLLPLAGLHVQLRDGLHIPGPLAPHHVSEPPDRPLYYHVCPRREGAAGLVLLPYLLPVPEGVLCRILPMFRGVAQAGGNPPYARPVPFNECICGHRISPLRQDDQLVFLKLLGCLRCQPHLGPPS